ncbi:alpha-(1,3)-fucosyltransferase C-like isoform X1 [Leptidea sinapis]|uniref:alpha-(1,3)-fucosyltransferase C-like isoform X1 n=1 Tax=Leptidea sinapis TaxID=189913 RepID=UPI002140121F|nr:alpha-(1,3)-fucosyltransferase C-like isoform X1 [Leptidea sinapis]XP_050682855.1 alpha-(1,3)-fucosyltransferase C-like isoform X1 [Leptidea sinapis]
MFLFFRLRHRCISNVRQMISARFFFCITCISFAISIIWIHFIDARNYSNNDSLVREALENVAKDHRFAEVYRKADRLSKDMKYMLLWTGDELEPFNTFGRGQRAFIQRNCFIINCYVTNDRNFFGGDVTKFDAIGFNGRSMESMSPWDLPGKRINTQKYIYFNMESADNYPVCYEHFENFFNWTSTYKLDSDIPYPYIHIKNINGEVIGPKAEMKWVESSGPIDNDVYRLIENKTKAVAWFVSNCKSRNHRIKLAKNLNRSLSIYGYSVDIYGDCGELKCPRDGNCNEILERDYFFYLSFENSFSEDYVTEKLLTALQHNVVPIVFGGADYSRFLPPGSYLDAKRSKPDELAATIATLIRYPKTYSHYFSWKNNYIYQDPSNSDNVCSVCAALNDKELFESHKTYSHFRYWWNPNYSNRCME